MYTLHIIFLQARPDEPMSNGQTSLLILGVITLIIIIILATRKKVGAIHSNQVFSFVDFQFSAQDYYAKVQELIAARQMPSVHFSRVNFAVAGLGQGKQEYLRVDRKDDIFDICASPFGTGSFVSYWYGEPKHRFKDLAYQIKGANTVVDAFNNKTRHELDSATVFRTWVKECIDLAIEDMTNQKGVRLSADEVNATA